MKLLGIRKAVLVFAAMSLMGGVTAASAQEFRLLSGWDKNYPVNPVVLDPFMKGVEAASKGRMKFNVSGPETVPPFEQLQPVGSGVFQFLFTHGAYHFGTSPLLTAFEALNADLAAIRAGGVLDFLDKQYQKYGVKLVALPMTQEGGYHLILRQPIGPSGDLAGRKVRATPTYASVLKLLGASPVALPPGEIYTALEKGVVDGAGWPVLGALNYRWYEVSKFIMRPAFGFVSQPIFMNLAAWNRLSQADKDIILAEARKVEDAYWRESVRMAAEEEKALIGKGMVVTQMGDSQRARLRSAWADGLFEFAATKNQKDVDELRQFARSKKLAN